MTKRTCEQMPPEGLTVWVQYADGFEWIDCAEMNGHGVLAFSEPVVWWCYMGDIKYKPDGYRYWDGTMDEYEEMRNEWNEYHNGRDF